MQGVGKGAESLALKVKLEEFCKTIEHAVSVTLLSSPPKSKRLPSDRFVIPILENKTHPFRSSSI